MNSDTKDIIESGRADNLIYVYTQLLDLRADFISRVNEAEGKYHVRLNNAEQVVYPKDELQAMVLEEIRVENASFISQFFASMLVSDILIEAKMHYPHKLDNPTKNPNTDKLIDITKEELVRYISTWYVELKERKSDD